eukprot:TRINITY_DN19_c0_g1_i1.p1 TRINITY_DN19_c0_g1~~TRINITY_DN19_c0_g1_i1.p1  ORF type:complete len:319 (-),score=43.51 TRINITY_DN19_c0_g1_i1:93-1049(-)
MGQRDVGVVDLGKLQHEAWDVSKGPDGKVGESGLGDFSTDKVHFSCRVSLRVGLLSKCMINQRGYLTLQARALTKSPLINHTLGKQTNSERHSTRKMDLVSTEVTKPTLTYFAIRAFAHIPRLVLELAKVDYTYVALTHDQWGPAKKDLVATGLFMFGQVPLYQEPGGFALAQSRAIARYLANKHGLAGETPQDRARADAILEGTADLTTTVVARVFLQPAEEQASAKAKYVADVVAPQVPHFDRLLQQNGGDYFVGSKLTVADVGVYAMLTFFSEWEGAKELWAKYPRIEAHIARIGAIPAIHALESNADAYSPGRH